MLRRLHEVLRGWRERLAQPTDASSLAAFRIAFGPLAAYEMWYKLAAGKLAELHQPEFHFKYLYFEWVPEPRLWQAQLLIWALIGLALLISLGLWFRPAALLLALGLSYYFTIEQTLYINHIYLYCLLAWILPFTHANSKWSLDARLGRVERGRPPGSRAGLAPYWNVWLLRFQMAVVYLYAGLAKLEPDWLSGRALELGLRARLTDSWAPIDLLSGSMSWGGALFDLGIVPLLLYQRTRLGAFGLACAFHVTNASIFGLASFPWMSIALTSLFLDRAWPSRVLGCSTRVPLLKALRRATTTTHQERASAGSAAAPLSPLATLGLGAYLLFQVLVPTRPWWYAGDANWTEEGHRFSWHMMLRGKRSSVRFFLQHPGQRRRYPVDVRRYVTPRQLVKMSGDPDAIHQLARFLSRRHASPDGAQPQVYVDARCSLNGRPRKRLIDPNVDLAAEPRGLAPARWIRRE